MDQSRRDFIQSSIALAGATGLTLKETAVGAAETETDMAKTAGVQAQTNGHAGQTSDKIHDLAAATTEDRGPLTTNVGQPISTDQNSLRAGARGPTLLEDFVLREKL